MTPDEQELEPVAPQGLSIRIRRDSWSFEAVGPTEQVERSLRLFLSVTYPAVLPVPEDAPASEITIEWQGRLYRKAGAGIWWADYTVNGQHFDESTGSRDHETAKAFLQRRIGERRSSAPVAQTAEHDIRNVDVGGSIPPRSLDTGPRGDEFWKEARERFEIGGERLHALARDMGIAMSTMWRRAKQDGWQKPANQLPWKHRRVQYTGSSEAGRSAEPQPAKESTSAGQPDVSGSGKAAPTPPPDVPWDKIREDYESGTKIRLLSRTYKIQPGSIRTRASRDKWKRPEAWGPPKPLPPAIQERRTRQAEERERIRECYEGGEDVAIIAANFKRTPEAVKKMAYHHDWTRPKRPVPPSLVQPFEKPDTGKVGITRFCFNCGNTVPASVACPSCGSTVGVVPDELAVVTAGAEV